MTTRTRRSKARAPVRAKPAPQRSAWPPLVRRRALVATDGSAAAQAALRFARYMEIRGDWEPEALTVLEPVPVSMAEVAFATPSDAYVQHVHDSVLAGIARQLKRYGDAAWQLGVEFGRVPKSIVDVARDHRADVIVLGLGKHGKLARLVGAETVARVARHATAPVLAVDAAARAPMRTAVVAVDFGASSKRAAREALQLLEPPARLHLLHVQWAFEGSTLRPAEWNQTYANGVAVGFARLAEELAAHPGVRVTSELRLGNVVETVLDVAGKANADLIASGSHNQDVVDRLLIGSTPSHLLRAAPCSVLVAPPLETSRDPRAGGGSGTD